MSEFMQRSTVIVGAGIIGICCARYLQLAGEKVTIVDREGIGDGCSHGNAGVLCTFAAQPAATPDVWRKLPKWILDPLGPVSLKLRHLPALLPWLVKFARAAQPQHQKAIGDAMFAVNHPSVELFRQLLSGSGHESLIADSNYVFATRKANAMSLDSPEWRQRAARGTPLKEVSGDELREMEPHVTPAIQKAILQQAHGRVTNPGRLVKVLGEMVMADGGEFLKADVSNGAPRAGGGAWLHTEHGGIECDRLIVCAGAWSQGLAKGFGMDVPLQGERGYHMEFRDPGVSLNNSVHDADHKFVANSMEGGLRCAGTSEFNALAAPPDWRRAQILKKLGQGLLPGLNVDDGEQWMGQRPAVPDSVPVISPAPGNANVIFAFGHGTYGLTGAPMTGRIVTSMATGQPLNIDVSAYHADRELLK